MIIIICVLIYEWIINKCDVNYMTFWENNNILTYNSSNKEIVSEKKFK